MKMKRTLLMVTAFIGAVSLGFFEPAGSGIRAVSAQTSQDTYAIRNARIVTITGPVIDSQCSNRHHNGSGYRERNGCDLERKDRGSWIECYGAVRRQDYRR